jgi:hydrogenase nickel insertion protein HypA
MHETALANSIVAAVLRHADQAKAERVLSVTVGLGEWSTYQREQVRFWIRVGLESTPAEGAALRFRKIPGKIRCLDCGRTGAASSATGGIDRYTGPVLRCPACSGSRVEIAQGREAMILKITMEGDRRD